MAKAEMVGEGSGQCSALVGYGVRLARSWMCSTKVGDG